MARSLDKIIKELDAGYDPSRDLINRRIKALPREAESQIAGLEAREQDYFDNTIMSGARQRGLGFSGIPEGERARYGATEFLPAVARVREGQNQSKLSLLEALAGLGRDQRSAAMGLYQTELDRDEQRRQFEASRRAQAAASTAASASPSWLQSLLTQSKGAPNRNLADVEEQMYQEWLRTQLRVSPTRPVAVSTGARGGVQGGGVSVQGSRNPQSGGRVKLQGGGSRSSSSLRVR